MILRQTIERLEPDSANGHQMKVVFHYSSFDEKEIDYMEKAMRSQIGDGIIAEYGQLPISKEDNKCSFPTFNKSSFCI